VKKKYLIDSCYSSEEKHELSLNYMTYQRIENKKCDRMDRESIVMDGIGK
jgi:hypothetical protein